MGYDFKIHPYARFKLHSIMPYIPGEPIEIAAKKLGLDPKIFIKLASNENPLGPSPLAMEVIKKEIEKLNLYPDDSFYYLKKKLSKLYDVPEDWIIIGNGSVEIINMLASAFLEPGEGCMFSEHSFIMYKIATLSAGGYFVSIPEKNYKHDIESFIKELSKKERFDIKIIFIDNPSNPLGTYLTKDEVDYFIKEVEKLRGESIILVFDQAYQEYIDEKDYPDVLEYVKKMKNIVVLHTFSKIYGLAGLRVGYAIAHPYIINALLRIRLPFNVNRLAQLAALTAVDDKEHIEKSKKVNNEGKAYLYSEFEKLGIFYLKSLTNFIFVDLKDEKLTKKIHENLLKKGIIVRPLRAYNLNTALRISIGTMEQNQRLIGALKEILKK